MSAPVLLDTGPLVAFLRRRDRYHKWAVKEFSQIRSPAFTCEPVLTEACFLMRDLNKGAESVLELVRTGIVQITFKLEDEIAQINKLVSRYATVPMSLADACLVRMSEQHSESRVLTLDRDFQIYRKHGRQVIPLIMSTERQRVH